MAKKLTATKVTQLGSSGNNPIEWEDLPGIKEQKPVNARFVEISLQRLFTSKTTILVQWMGAKNGVWYPVGDIWLITKK